MSWHQARGRRTKNGWIVVQKAQAGDVVLFPVAHLNSFAPNLSSFILSKHVRKNTKIIQKKMMQVLLLLVLVPVGQTQPVLSQDSFPRWPGVLLNPGENIRHGARHS